VDAGIPVVPGSDGDITDMAEARARSPNPSDFRF